MAPFTRPTYLIPCGMIAGALLGFVINKKAAKSRNILMISIILIVLFGAGPSLFLVYQYNSLHPIAWSDIEGREPDFSTDAILGNSEENGKLVITFSVGNAFMDGTYSEVEIVVDSNTKIYKPIPKGFVAASKDELLKPRHQNISVWFRGGSEVEGHKYRGTGEAIVID